MTTPAKPTKPFRRYVVRPSVDHGHYWVQEAKTYRSVATGMTRTIARRLAALLNGEAP